MPASIARLIKSTCVEVGEPTIIASTSPEVNRSSTLVVCFAPYLVANFSALSAMASQTYATVAFGVSAMLPE